MERGTENELWEKKKLGKGSPQVLSPNSLVAPRLTVFWSSWSPGTPQYESRRFLLWTGRKQHGVRRKASRTRPKHASLEQSAKPMKLSSKNVCYWRWEMSRCNLPKSFCGVVLPNYVQPVHFISLECQTPQHPRKFGTSGTEPMGENKESMT